MASTGALNVCRTGWDLAPGAGAGDTGECSPAQRLRAGVRCGRLRSWDPGAAQTPQCREKGGGTQQPWGGKLLVRSLYIFTHL